MKKLFLLIVFLITSLAANEYYTTKILFCLDKNIDHLDFSFAGTRVNTTLEPINKIFNRYGVINVQRWLPQADERDVVGDIKLANIYEVEFSTPQKAAQLRTILEDFRAVREVHSADLIAVNHIQGQIQPYVPSDTYFPRQWYVPQIGADLAWALWGNQTPGDSTVLVGVVDTGIDYTHPDLANMLYLNPGEDVDGDGHLTAVDSNGVDDDGNGYVDDFHGWDFAGAKQPNENPDNDILPPDSGPQNELSHGTHVAGIIAAQADNGLGIAGISFRGRIIATKHAFDDDLTEPSIVKGYSGVLYCAKMGAKIINCSWGGGPDFYGKVILQNVTKNYNAIVVAAAGNDNQNNDNTNHYPSNYESTVAIAALNAADRKAYYSNYGKAVDLSAPGGEGSSYSNAIFSTIHKNAGGYAAWQGTSMASPVAAGAFALLKAWFPQAGREWLIDNMLASADPIDELNPNYKGLLGSGRVNVYNAIARTLFPELSLYDFSYAVRDDNGDNVLNPGESISMYVTLENREGWLPANDISISLSTNSPYLELIDSTARINTLAPGEVGSFDGEQLVARISPEATYEPIRVIISISANPDSAYPYTTSALGEILLSLDQPGFPKTGMAVSAPLAADRFAGQKRQIVAVTQTNQLYLIKSDGAVAAGFPVDVGTTTAAPVVADMDNDGQKEIVVVNRSGQVFILNPEGRIKKLISVNEPVYGDAAVANMDDDPDLEIVFGTMRQKLHVLNPDSSELAGFPLKMSGLINEGVALADFDGDKIPEIVVGTFDGNLHVITASGDSLAGFPVALDARLRVTPVTYTYRDSTNIIAVSLTNKLYRVSAGGSLAMTFDTEEAISGPPSLYDADNDGRPEIFFGLADGTLAGIDGQGRVLDGFPFSADSKIIACPVFADPDQDGQAELVFASAAGKIYVIHSNGQLYPNFPAQLSGTSNASPALADVDDDGDSEFILGMADELAVLDLPGGTNSASLWQTYLGNNQRTGNYSDALTGLDQSPLSEVLADYLLMQNYPNPFNPQTSIEFRVPAGSGGQKLTLAVYDLLGRKIRTLYSGPAISGTNRFIWDGKNQAGISVGSGIYLYRLQGTNIRLTRRMLLIK